MIYSYSNVDTYRQCPMRWYFRYIKKMRSDLDLVPNNPLLIGTLMHEALEHGIELAEANYYSNYPIINDRHVEEVIKASRMVSKVDLPEGVHEFKLDAVDFVGYIDYVSYNEDGSVSLWDFKYSNNKRYIVDSMQLHIYKYYYELLTGQEVSSLHYLFIPKLSLKKDFEMTTGDFRLLLEDELEDLEPEIVDIEFSQDKVAEYFGYIKEIEAEDTKLVKKIGPLCHWCDYEKICFKINLDS